ncbi:hypothetical protein CEXT_96031 [Caerostris extrusa]|uniref:Uncharacterized protein n=1 Tax=Caerostris extrusa TaxID=172846 RepID=A0AAV4W260_CAEEX|nr:hypothetical protein CEXT_96031 [Caerostris extrusa]
MVELDLYSVSKRMRLEEENGWSQLDNKCSFMNLFSRWKGILEEPGLDNAQTIGFYFSRFVMKGANCGK